MNKAKKSELEVFWVVFSNILRCDKGNSDMNMFSRSALFTLHKSEVKHT